MLASNLIFTGSRCVRDHCTSIAPLRRASSMIHSTLSTSRARSIDVFRGIVIFTMVFVNELSGIIDIPLWMKHLPADADGMTFVDLVFPAFLFIVGMSIPFAVQARADKGDSVLTIFQHLVLRSLGLLVIGVFMVNAEYGHNEMAMKISISLWTFTMYIAVLLIFSHYSKRLSSALAIAAKLLGVTILATLWWLYQGSESTGMTPQWWGILGLIGWAYLIAGVLFLLIRQFSTNKHQLNLLIAAALALIALFYGLNQLALTERPILPWLIDNNRNHTHAAIVLAGIILSQLMYSPILAAHKSLNYFAFSTIAALLAFGSWQLSPISKIWATPSWALFSILFCCFIFGAIYWLVDIKQRSTWASFFEPAAQNPLLVYILPYILLSLFGVFGFSLRPDIFNSGIPGIIWSLGFACTIMAMGALLTRVGLRVKL